MSNSEHIELSLTATASLARLVRMTAANVATLSSMSVERVEDIRMAAEEAFIYACSTSSDAPLRICFDVDPAGLAMRFELDAVEFAEGAQDDPTSMYADLILGSVCDSYEKVSSPATLILNVKADV